MKNHCFIILTLIFFPFGKLNAQYHVNTEWSLESGNPIFNDWSYSITNDSNQLIHVGNSLVPSQGANVLLSKYDASGSLLWQSNYNSSGVNNDYGIKLTEDALGNIYVIGTTDNNNTSTDFDVIVLKYSSSGSLLWSQIYGAPYAYMDVAIGLTPS